MKLSAVDLPKGFVLAKPITQENYDESHIYELERKGRLVITRKRDGWKLLAHVNRNKQIHLYTDGINEIDARLDHIKKDLKHLKLPADTLVVGEAVIDLNDNDDFGRVISVFHSDPVRAKALQKEHSYMRMMVFGVIDLTGNDKPILNPLSGSSISEKLKFVFNVPVLALSFDKAKEAVATKNWEGLVLYDKDYRLTYRTDGKNPARPDGCYKWKPIWEDDFIVRRWIPRENCKPPMVKELVLSQLDPVTSREFYCGKLGSFSNDMRRELTSMEYPLVVQVRFDMRFPKTGKVRNVRFMRIRTDKNAANCISPKSHPEAEYK